MKCTLKNVVFKQSFGTCLIKDTSHHMCTFHPDCLKELLLFLSLCEVWSISFSCSIINEIENWFVRSLHTITLICFDIIPCTMYRIESVAIMCCHVGRVMKPGANSRASQSQSQSHVCALHTHPNTHINKPTVHFQPLTFIANDCSLNVSRLRTFLTEKEFYIFYFTDVLKVMKVVIYKLIIPSLFLPKKQVFSP